MNVTVTKANESVIYDGKIYTHGQSFDVAEPIGKSLIERKLVEETVEPSEVAVSSQSEVSSTEGSKSRKAKKSPIAPKNEVVEANAEEDETPEELPNTDMPE